MDCDLPAHVSGPTLPSDPCVLSVCLSELLHLVCTLNEMLQALPSVLISILEQQQRTKLREDVDRVRVKLQETLIWSQKEKVSRTDTSEL